MLEGQLQLQPANSSYCRIKCRLLEEAGRLEESEESLTYLLELMTNDPQALADRARVRLYLGRFDQALQDIDIAVRSGEDIGYRHYLRGRILYRSMRDRDALDAFDVAKANGFNQLRLYSGMIDALIYLGLLEQALEVANEVLTSVS